MFCPIIKDTCKSNCMFYNKTKYADSNDWCSITLACEGLSEIENVVVCMNDLNDILSSDTLDRLLRKIGNIGNDITIPEDISVTIPHDINININNEE